MSTYLSPILSSGDSTPAENVQSAPSAAENATEFPVRKFKVQTNQQQEENSEKQAGGKQQSAAERRAKTRLRSMGNSMLRDELSDGDIGDEEIDQDDSDEENYQSDRLRFASNLQNYLTNNNNNNSNNSNKTNTQAQKSTTNKATTAQGVHQCLADQFRSMTARGSNSSSGSGKGEARSSSVSSEGELLSGGAEGGNQFRKLFKSAASNQRRLNKKVKQILQSIPVMPLVATTSIMTIILLSLLLLGDSLHVATAARSPPAPLEPQALSGAGDRQDKQDQPDRDGPARMQSLVMEPARESPPAQAESANFGSANNEQRAPDPDPAQLSSLRRELIGSYLAQRQQLPAKAEQHAQAGSERRPTFRQLLLLREQQDHQAKSKRRHHQQAAGGDSGSGLINSLGAMLFGASANQQQSANRQLEGESQAETAELSGPARDEEETLGELEERGRESAEQQAAGFMLDGEPPAARATATSHHHHQPAHLRSSTLELELSPEAQTVSQPQRNPNLIPNNNININKQPARARPSNQVVSLMRQQHINRHPFQREPPPKTPMGRQRQPAMFSGMNHPAFDLPQIECNNTAEGFERFACPTPNEEGKYRCIEDVLFCDGYYDCPHGEDEERTSCMYYRLFVSHIDILTNTFLTWMKSQNRQAANNHHANQHSHRQHLVDELDTA